MVARQAQTPKTTGERVARLAELHGELRRAVGQGATALVDGDGNVLSLMGGDVAALTSESSDAMLSFNADGTLSAVGMDGSTPAGFSAGDATLGNISMNGNAIFSETTDGAMRFHTDAEGSGIDSCNRSGTEYRGMRSSNFLTVTPSWRSMKTHHRSTRDYLGHDAVDVVDRLQIGAWRYDPVRVPAPYADGRDHYGLMLDELPIEFTRTVRTPSGAAVTTYDRDEVLNLALAAVQDRGREVDSLRALVERQQAQIEELAARVVKADVPQLPEA